MIKSITATPDDISLHRSSRRGEDHLVASNIVSPLELARQLNALGTSSCRRWTFVSD